MNRFEELESFVAVVEFQGFSRAGEELGIAKSMVSRRVSELEKRLGVQLLQRTTRRQALTDSGREFYQRAMQILADLNEAESYVSDAQCRLAGKIKLALPLSFGVSQLAQPISEFLEQNPEIRVDIDLNDRQIDLIEENIDLAVRIGELEDSSLIARKLARIRFATCASPAYLRAHGEPRHPAELDAHQLLVYSNITPARQWGYEEGGKLVNPRANYRLSANNGDFLATAATHGVAIVNGPLALLQAYIERGELVPILAQYARAEVGMYAVYPPGRLVSRRVKALSDALYEHFRERGI